MKQTEEIPPCTVRDDVSCSTCTTGTALHCRWDKNILLSFLAIAIPLMAGTLLLLIIPWMLSGIWWPIAAYLVYAFVYFMIFEIRFLCSHCPYYAGEGKVLKCLGNNGAIKFYKYHPEPMNATEKCAMKVLVWTYALIIPLLSGIWALWVVYAGNGFDSLFVAVAGIFIMLITSSATFFQVMKTYYCNKCVNFSCPLNTVEKQYVDAYLQKNDVMREAWINHGYQYDEPEKQE